MFDPVPVLESNICGTDWTKNITYLDVPTTINDDHDLLAYHHIIKHAPKLKTLNIRTCDSLKTLSRKLEDSEGEDGLLVSIVTGVISLWT